MIKGFFKKERNNVKKKKSPDHFRRVGVLIGHRNEISNALFNFDCDLIASSSVDKTAKIWDPRMFTCLVTITGHDSDVKSTFLFIELNRIKRDAHALSLFSGTRYSVRLLR